MELVKILEKACDAKNVIANLGVTQKNKALNMIADELLLQAGYIKAENEKDIARATKAGMKQALVDRLTLNDARIEGMAEGIRQVAALEDPIGEVTQMKTRPNGLMIGKKTVPIGVIGIIYESRPNVTADAFSLCFKAGNVSVLRGGSDAINSNIAIVKVIKDALLKAGIDTNVLQLITDTTHESVNELMHMNEYVDVLIPRGGRNLIKNVVNNSTIPVIETGTGNCHIYVDKYADFDMAVQIIFNAKTQRIGVCNACESLVIHKDVAKEVLPLIVDKLKEKNVEIRGDELSRNIDSRIIEATQEDFGCEYLDYIISVKIVNDIDEAIKHINKYNTKHSEAIITKDYACAQKFLQEIDAAAVYVNASTRFTDGFEFGFGAEIGISTQKLHARGPMGLKELTTYKYIIYGNGQIRQ